MLVSIFAGLPFAQRWNWKYDNLRNPTLIPSFHLCNKHTHTYIHTHTHTHVVFAWRKRIRPDVMATRQSLCGGPRSSNQGLIGCQSNLIPSSCEASWYDISGTSIHREHRALAGRQRFGSGHFSSARMSQILQSFLISVLWEEVFAKYQTCCGFRGLSNRLRCWWNSQEIFYSFFFLSPQLNAAGISVGSIVDCRFFDWCPPTLFQFPAKGCTIIAWS